MRETGIMHKIQLAMSRAGSRLFRNNCGALQDRHGQWIRFGIANPGGSDLIGWTPVRVHKNMIGKTIAVFTAVEAKTRYGMMTEEQSNFIMQVNKQGGIAFVATGSTDAAKQIDGHKVRLQGS